MIRDGPSIHSVTKEKVKISDFHSDYKLKTMTRPSKWVNESFCQIQFQVSTTYPSDLTLKAKAVQQTRADSSKTFTAAIFSSTLSMKDSTKTALSNELTIFFLINDTKSTLDIQRYENKLMINPDRTLSESMKVLALFVLQQGRLKSARHETNPLL